jgi:hypothetical protein
MFRYATIVTPHQGQWVKVPEFTTFPYRSLYIILIDSNNAQAIFFMKLQGCRTAGGNSSSFIGYLMREGETGLICVSEIMRDGIFQQDLGKLQKQQKTDFLTQFGGKVDWWQNRQLTEKDSPKVHANRARILARAAMIDDDGPRRKIHRTPDHERIQEVVHSISLTQKFHQTAGMTNGKDFIEPLPKSLLTDQDGAEKIKAAVLAVRDCFPANLPLMLTVHFDRSGQNPHIQGWVSEKEWNSESGIWDKPLALLDTPSGLQKLWVDVAKAVENATGASFNRDKADDPLRPKRTVFHPRTAYWVQQYRHSDLIKGDFLQLEQNTKAREATRQLIEQVRYDENKLVVEAKAARFSDTLSTAEEIFGLFKVQAGTMGKAASTMQAGTMGKAASAPSVTSTASDIAAAMAGIVSGPSATSSANDIEAAMRQCNYVDRNSNSPRI